MAADFLRQSFLFAALLTGSGLDGAVEQNPVSDEEKRSPELLELLRSEMREISGDVQAMALAIATADWG